MKKLLLPLLAVVLFTTCKKEVSTDKAQEEIATATASRTSPKITICHKSKTILIDKTAWPEHQAHGDLLGDCSAVLVKICNQDWMRKNLDVSRYRDGTPIPEVQDPIAWANLTTGAWCYYANISANGTTYGKLYNWYAVAGIYNAASLAHQALRKKLAPVGWHVPNDAEWETLIKCLHPSALQDCIQSPNPQSICEVFPSVSTVAGGMMKEPGTTNWLAPNIGATNSSGFTGLPGGYRIGITEGNFYDKGVAGVWYSSDEVKFAWSPDFLNSMFILNTNNSDVFIHSSNKNEGFSVRCVRDR